MPLVFSPLKSIFVFTGIKLSLLEKKTLVIHFVALSSHFSPFLISVVFLFCLLVLIWYVFCLQYVLMVLQHLFNFSHFIISSLSPCSLITILNYYRMGSFFFSGCLFFRNDYFPLPFLSFLSLPFFPSLILRYVYIFPVVLLFVMWPDILWLRCSADESVFFPSMVETYFSWLLHVENQLLSLILQ